MSVFAEKADVATPIADCARCAEPACFEVWGHPVCVACWGDWRGLEHTAGSVDRALGITLVEGLPHRRGVVIGWDEWQRLTGLCWENIAAKWVATKREAA